MAHASLSCTFPELIDLAIACQQENTIAGDRDGLEVFMNRLRADPEGFDNHSAAIVHLEDVADFIAMGQQTLIRGQREPRDLGQPVWQQPAREGGVDGGIDSSQCRHQPVLPLGEVRRCPSIRPIGPGLSGRR